jgi:hypothetical protein
MWIRTTLSLDHLKMIMLGIPGISRELTQGFSGELRFQGLGFDSPRGLAVPKSLHGINLYLLDAQ